MEKKQAQELMNIIASIQSEISHSNQQISEEAYRKAREEDVYVGATDRYLHQGTKKLPVKDNSIEYVYEHYIKNVGLEDYFTKEEFEKVYYITRKKNSKDFWFDSEFLGKLWLYVFYKDYIATKEEQMTFEDFIENDIYGKIKREERVKKYKEETAEMQRNFVPKSDAELKALYEQDKDYINMNYIRFVQQIGCSDILPLSEFLKLYDLADRDYRNTGATIDQRVMFEILNKYYEEFVVIFGYGENISYGDFCKLFDKAYEMDKTEFKKNITSLVEQQLPAEEVSLEDLNNQTITF